MSTTSSEIWPGERGERTMSLSLPNLCVIWSAITAASLTNAGWSIVPCVGDVQVLSGLCTNLRTIMRALRLAQPPPPHYCLPPAVCHSAGSEAQHTAFPRGGASKAPSLDLHHHQQDTQLFAFDNPLFLQSWGEGWGLRWLLGATGLVLPHLNKSQAGSCT